MQFGMDSKTGHGQAPPHALVSVATSESGRDKAQSACGKRGLSLWRGIDSLGIYSTISRLSAGT